MKVTTIDSSILLGQGPMTPSVSVGIGMGSAASQPIQVPSEAPLTPGAQPPATGPEPESQYSTIGPVPSK